MTLNRTILLVLALPWLGCGNPTDVGRPLRPGPRADPDPTALLEAPKEREKNEEPKHASEDSRRLPPGWFSDYDKALAEAKRTGKPLLVVFH